MKKLILSFLILSAICSVPAWCESDIWVDGYVYSIDSMKKQNVVPFASVYYYDINNHNDVKYCAMTGVNGYYEFKPYDHSQAYFVRVTAPGYKQVTFRVKSFDGKNKLRYGNTTIHIEMQKNDSAADIVSKEYNVNDLCNGQKIKTLSQLFPLIPGLKFDGSDLIDESGNSVCLFVNGMNCSLFGDYHEVLNMSCSKFDKVTFYKIPAYLGRLYGGVLDVKIKRIGEAKPPKYELRPSIFAY